MLSICYLFILCLSFSFPSLPSQTGCASSQVFLSGFPSRMLPPLSPTSTKVRSAEKGGWGVELQNRET